MIYDARAFSRTDESPDEHFYRQPRFVEHIDAVAITDVEKLHRGYVPAGGAVLDLMSSWVSHLPSDVSYTEVVGLGMNAAELEGNPRLDAHVVQNLNVTPTLPFADDRFDAATICVSIQYLQHPIDVLRELARVVRPNGVAVVTFSNRCFPTKAVAIWRALEERGHRDLVAQYFASAGWTAIESFASPPRRADPLSAVIARVPYAE